MTILHARSAPQFTDHLRTVIAKANGQSQSGEWAPT